MEIKFIDNQDTKLSAVLVSELKGSLDTRLAVAFVSSSGLTLLEQSILEALSNGGQIEMLVGLDFTTTEARALWKLNTWAKEHKTFNFYCLPLGGPTIYHPKMYLMSNLIHGSIIVGSSNLTAAGLSRNAEANIFIKVKGVYFVGKEQASKTIKSFILCATKGLQYASKANANSQGFSWLVETCL